jgi:hypothetical protein
MDIPDNNEGDLGSDQALLPELPMPKDSHLLAPQSRALLRAARAGYIYLRPAKREAEENVKEVPDVEEIAPAAKIERSFTARKWTQVPKHLESSEAEFLAKRRQGLPSLYGAAGTVNAATATVAGASQPMRKAKIQKVDPITGDVAIYDAWIPEGQKLDGEIKEDAGVAPAQQDATVTKVVPAPGTVVDGVGVANAEGIVVAGTERELSASKRKGPPPPKRKAKGIGGKGRKKVQFVPGEGDGTSALQGVEGTDDRMIIDGEQYEDDEEEDEDEEDEEQVEGIRTEEQVVVDNKTSIDALLDSTTISATEQIVAQATESSNEDTILPDEPRRPPIEALSPAPSILEPTPAPAELSDKSSPEKQQSVEKVQSEASESLPPATVADSDRASTVVESSITAVNDEILGDVDDAAKPLPDPVALETLLGTTSQPAADGSAMEGIEPTDTNLPGLNASGFAPASEKVDMIDGVDEAETVEKPELTQHDAVDHAVDVTAPATTAKEAITAPAPSERVDLLETLEASLGNGEVKPEENPAGVTVSASADPASLTASVEPPTETSSAALLSETVSTAVEIFSEAPAEIHVSEGAAEPVIAEDVSELSETATKTQSPSDAAAEVDLETTHAEVKDAQT